MFSQLTRAALTLALWACIAIGSSSAQADSIDPATGLKQADNWRLVQAHCGACHSYRLITAQRGDRDYWLKTIRWMQRTQNLWLLPPAVENPMLDYLAENYSESEWGRRPALSPTLLPDYPAQ